MSQNAWVQIKGAQRMGRKVWGRKVWGTKWVNPCTVGFCAKKLKLCATWRVNYAIKMSKYAPKLCCNDTKNITFLHFGDK